MAKQTGPLYRTGTVGPVTYYKLFGEHYYMRSKSCLDSQRFYKDPAFAGSRKRSKEFGGAASLASYIYKLLPKANRGKGFMGKFIGRVHRLLLAGYTAEAIQAEALREYGVEQVVVQPEKELLYKIETKIQPDLFQWVATVTGRLEPQAINYEGDTTTDKLPDD